jgi:putative oxidoreductase
MAERWKPCGADVIETVKENLTSKHIAFLFRIYIGCIFIYASLHKINNPGAFAETITNYQILHYNLVGLTAIILPWLELICASLLILGVRSKASALILASLLCVFIVAISINLLRDAPISCGCFHSKDDVISWVTIVRDVAWLLMTIYILLFDRVLMLDRLIANRIFRDFEQQTASYQSLEKSIDSPVQLPDMAGSSPR